MSMSDSRTGWLPGALLAAGLALAGPPAFGQDEAQSGESAPYPLPARADGAEWACESCPFAYGAAGETWIGLGYVSDDSFEFGNYRGYEDGVFGVLGVDAFYRAEDGRYLEVYGDRLGLDSRDLVVEGGRQGRYSAWFEYDAIPFSRVEGTRTVFVGAGIDDQRLPADWVFADNTRLMTALDDSLRAVDVGHDRETLSLGFELGGESPWRYRMEAGQSTKEGSVIRGGSFMFRAAELLAPVDYETTRVEAAIGYVQDTWELEAAYTLSTFDNAHESLRWQNPYTPFLGATEGQLAASPDSEAQQLMLSGSWRHARWLTIAGQVAMGRLEQDEPFLDYTRNANLLVPALPRSNLDGEVDTQAANLRITGALTERLSAKAEFHYDERDNQTPRDAYLQVVTDLFVTEERVNEPYSYERQSAEATVDYELFSRLDLSASAEREEMERSFQEVEDTETDLYTLQARSRPFDDLGVNLKLTREERTNDLDPALLGPTVNASLRRFHFADKERDAARLMLDYALGERWMAGVFAEVAEEEFSDTRVGLSDARAESYGLDLSAALSDSVSAYGFVSFEQLEADIRGADMLDPNDLSGDPWRAEQNDEFRTVGFGVEFRDLPGNWVRGALDFTYAGADGEIVVATGEPAPDFPDLRTRRYSMEASLERVLKEHWNLGLSWLVARFPEDSFFVDGVEPDTVPTLLGLGERTPDETVHVIRAMLRYSF